MLDPVDNASQSVQFHQRAYLAYRRYRHLVVGTWTVRHRSPCTCWQWSGSAWLPCVHHAQPCKGLEHEGYRTGPKQGTAPTADGSRHFLVPRFPNRHLVCLLRCPNQAVLHLRHIWLRSIYRLQLGICGSPPHVATDSLSRWPLSLLSAFPHSHNRMSG